MGKDLFNDRISRFSIRKLNVGVCSVLLGTLVMVGVANQVSADETSNQTQVEDVTNTTAVASEGTQSQNTVATQASMEVANILSSSEANSQSQAVSTASQTVSEASTTPASSEATSQAAVSTSEASVNSVASSNSVASTVNVAGSTTGASTTASSLAATSESQASAPASEAQNVNVEVEASSSNSLSGGVESPVVEQPVVTAETSGKRRSRRSIADPNDPNLIADDVQDATSTPKETKPGFTTNIKATDLASQISWLDFGDTANWTGTTTTSSGNLALQVGSTYTKEIMPGYVVTIKVKSLKPFQATEIYKKRLENRGATEAEKATYDPNARNGYVNGATSNYTKAAFSAGEEAKVIAEAQNQWTEIRKEGINTGTKKTTISSEFDGGNIGVQFEISATFRGKVVKPAIVMADGESANPGELVMFTTNGEGWQHIGEWLKNNNKNTKTYIPQNTDNLFGSSPSTNINGMNLYRTNLDQLRRSTQVGPDKKAVAWKYFGSADLTTGGLGTGVFGPNISSSDVAVPLVMTKGASEIGLYIVSGGKQSAMFGFFPLDEGDAPESYGKAIHSIATVDGITGKKVNQPYLGHLSPDMDENNALDWFGDDNATTADEGVDQLLPAELKGTTNEMIKMDRTHPGNYTITLEAHTDGAPQANIYGWIDFNQNGTFDEDERSELATITKDGSVTLRFTKSKTYIDPSVNELGVRVRIAKDAVQIESPTGMAFSGEVEDFRTQVTHPPKGEVKETTGLQGEKQSSTVAFTARGLYKYSLTDKAQIDETVAPQMVDNRTGQVVTPGADGYYAVAGQGKYKITPNGTSVDVEFIPEDHFLGTADGISIRRTDTNGYDTGWSTKFPDMEANVDTAINTMDGLYIPTVTPKDIEGESKTSTDVQGATQTGTPTFNVVGTNLDGNKITVTPSALYPAKLVDPATGQPTNALSVTVAGEGTYTIDDTTGKVTFVPEPGFTGTANGVTVTLSAPVGRDKDGTIRDEYVKTATAKYTPTVTPITVTPTNKVSADVQNVPQTQTPTFDLSNDKTAQITSKKLVDPTTGQPTDDATVTVAGEGSYTIDPTTGAVTFTPEKDFVGTATGVTVQATATITNANGKTATITSDATYTPTVVAAVPTAQPAKSKDIQGATQTGTPTFAGTTVQVNGQDKAITIKDNSYKLLDKDGNEVTGTTPAYAADGTTVIGNFSIDSATGTVTFTPTDKSYTGAVTPAKVQAESSNGIKVATTYTPEIVPVSPTATPAESTDIQGATQTGKPEFQGGTVSVDGVDKTVAINEAVPATFDDGTKTKTIPNVGTYTVAADGTVTFVPEKSFVGTAPAVTVVREDMNGTKAQATYTPTVTPVKPTADPATSTGKQGQEQTGKPVFTEGNSRVPMNDRVAATFDDGSTTKVVPNVGTYTVASDGTVTFVPEKSFTGEAPAVTVVREDMNGTKAQATYTPTVTPVTPTATPAESTGPQGVVQTGTVTFTEGDPVAPIDKNTITLLDENGQPAAAVFAKSPAGVIIGTFTVDKITSVVTFTPSDKSYSGEVVPVKVRAADTNGTTVETTYTPKITPVVPTAEDATSTDIQGATQTGKPTFTEGDSRVPMDDDTPATFEDGSKTKTVDGVGTYTVAADGTVTFKPLPTYVGTPEGVTVKRVDKNGTAVTAKYTPTVTPVVPSATPAVSEDVQGATQTGKPEFTAGNSRVPMNDAVPATFDDGSKTKTVDGVGTYTVATDGTVTFVPDPSFTGTAPAVTVVREDMNGTKASATYTPTVNPVTVTPTNKVSEDVQNVPQTDTPTFALSSDKTAQITSKKLVNPATGQPTDDATVTVEGEGSYTIDPTTGAVTFTPEKDFVGTAKGVTVQATATITNENGKTATITSDATYTPTVVAAVPTAQPAKSKDIQGATQTGTPTFAGTTVQVNGQDKAITIKDNSYKLLDKDGNEVTGTTPAYAADGTTVIGNFSIDSATGTVTFTPTDKSYTGAVTPAKVQAESSNGIKVATTYTPEIVPVSPTATPAESTDIQGATQTGKPEFQGGTVSVDGVDKTVAINEAVPATFDDGTKTKTIPNVGTYTVAADGTVTFVPEKSFVGTAPAVTVVREDMNGTKAQATYTPTVTPVKPTADPATSTGKQGQTQTGKPEFTEGNSRVPMNDDVPATFDDGTTTKTVPNVGTYTVASDGTVTFVPEKSFTGEAPAVTVVRKDMNGTKASATYTPTVTPVTPTATPAESTGPQGLVQMGTVTFTEGDPVAPINKDSITLLDENGQPAASVDAKSPAGDVIGTYTVDKETGVVTFTPTDKSYSGDVVPAKVQAADTNGTTVETTYTPKITPVVPTAEPATSTDIQGATQTGKPVFTEGDSRVPMDDTVPATFDDGSTTKTVDGVGTYTVASDGTVTFKPLPTYVGTPEGVTVKRVDKNGTPATATYTPTVTPVTPTATPAETSGVQGATQSGKPVFTEGNSRVPMNDAVPATFDDGSTSKTVDGIGTYTVAADGTVTFVPDPSFTGTAPAVTVVREDKNGTKASATYTPTVNPVTLTPTNKVSEDIQNVPQTETPTFALSDDETAQITSKKLIDPATGQPTDETSVTVAGEGTYTIDPTTGAVTFTPEKDFVGTAKGVTVQATATVTNEAGKTSTITSDASYTPTVVAAVPTAQPATSKDIQGATQTGTPTFAGTTVQVNGQDKTITIKDNSYTLLDKDGNEVSTTPAYAADGTTEIGTYSIDLATGQVTFTPTDKSYTGQVTPVKVQAESSNGIKVDTTYTPEIVPVTPTATPAETTDIQGATQTGKPEFKGGTVTVDGVEKTVDINEDVPATFDDGSTTKTVDGVGTYTVASDGTVTFVPEKSFVGTAPAVTVVREDKNGTKASATYTPTVTPVTPTATPVETTDIQGATQTGKPVFTEGDSRVPMNDDVPATFDDGSTTKTVDGVGTYTVASDGTVTFVPEKSFTGKAPAVTVVREDKNGTKASATYTPTVTPVTPTATPVETTGKQGQTQTGKPEFTEGDSRVPMNDDVPATFDDGSTTKTVDGVGTYTVAADGTVTFVPEKSFTGKAPAVTVVREDKNGTKASATYTPTVTPVTPTATPVESTGPQGLVQTGTVIFTEGDEVAPINKDSITLLDENGQPAASVEAKSPLGDVIGTYTVDKDTGVVTFTPTDKSYSGDVVPVKVQAADTNGTTVETTYTPKITPVVPTSEDATSTDIQGQTQSGKPTFTEGNSNVPIDEDTPATFEDGSTTKTVDGEGTYTVAADGTVTFVPEKSFTGTATGVTVKRVDKNGTEITAKYTPTVTPVTPTATPAESTDIQGATQTGKPVFIEGDSRVPMNDDVPATFEDGSTTKTVDGVGTYTVAADGTVTFVPEKSFVGTAPAVTVVREDKNGTKASATYTPSVTPVTPTAEDTTSTDKQGQTQSGTPTFTPGNPNVPMDDDTPATFEDGSTTKVIPGEGTYTVAPDGTVTFVPEKSFTGEGTGVTVKRVDKNGTSVTAKYTPTVTPVTPTATPAESTGPQGIVQTGTVTFTEGDPVAPIDKDTITLLDENGQPAASVDAKSPAGDVIGTFTVDKETGLVTFTPTDKSYSGDVVPVKVQAKDTNGTPTETTYTPKITPVVPTADPATSTDIQGQTQTGKPSFTPGNPNVPMDDATPATFEDGSTTKTIPGEGTYTVAPDGTVTFVPEKSFTGTGTGVTVKRVDKNGTPVTATYTPTVTPVTPIAKDTTSTDKQGQTQTGKPKFTEGDSRVPMNDDVPATFDDGSTTKTVEGVGTYTVAADGTVTFVPEKSFVGTAPAVTVVREDKNGTKASATYTPTVTPVIPTATPAESTGPQGATQTGKPEFTEGDSRVPMNDDVPATFEDGSTTKTIPGEGTYTVAPDGTVTFVPEKSFTGTGTGVTVKRVDKNGTPVTATYTPTVTPVTPTATPAESTGPQGVVQTGTVTFTEGDPAAPIDKDTITLLDENGQPATSVIAKSPEGKEIGTYTVDKTTGVVTFTPTDKSYSGEVVPVKVQAKDTNGTPTETTYTPKITPVVPTADPATSTDIQGQTQSGKPSFTPGTPAIPMDDDVPATFEDGSTTKTIPGEGTYTVAPDGTVTFVPEKSFTGTGTGVTVKRVDKNGTPVAATYTPTVTPVTPTAESTTSIGNKGQTQTGKPVFTEGDSRVPMNDKVPATFDDGSTTKTIPGVGTYTVAADGTVTFTPEAEFTGTAPAVTVVREDVNGTKASATYTPTVRPITKFVDKEGKEIPGYPALDGEQPKAEISGYRFVETKKLPNGDFEHVYEKVTTSYVDENGTPIPGYPTEEGQQPKKDIPGYEFVKTVVDENGNIQHIYKKTVTPTPVPDSTPTPEPQPTPQAKQEESVLPETKEEARFINPTDENAQLPKTGSEDSNLAIFGLASLLAGFGLYGTKRRKR
ncbi:GEVED domain-containing protein [Streptococcus sp.]|uniref:GEVED domain-containing protein n=3 Tax=Streptococcus TaxID=1301 RepID=UPI0039931463